jgi:hypothetical protein
MRIGWRCNLAVRLARCATTIVAAGALISCSGSRSQSPPPGAATLSSTPPPREINCRIEYGRSPVAPEGIKGLLVYRGSTGVRGAAGMLSIQNGLVSSHRLAHESRDLHEFVRLARQGDGRDAAQAVLAMAPLGAPSNWTWAIDIFDPIALREHGADVDAYEDCLKRVRSRGYGVVVDGVAVGTSPARCFATAKLLGEDGRAERAIVELPVIAEQGDRVRVWIPRSCEQLTLCFEGYGNVALARHQITMMSEGRSIEQVLIPTPTASVVVEAGQSLESEWEVYVALVPEFEEVLGVAQSEFIATAFARNGAAELPYRSEKDRFVLFVGLVPTVDEVRDAWMKNLNGVFATRDVSRADLVRGVRIDSDYKTARLIELIRAQRRPL